MNRYVMLRNEETGEIKIIDNSTHIGKGKVSKLAEQGFLNAGIIESDLGVATLTRGISHSKIIMLEEQREAIKQVRQVLALID